MRPHHHLSDRNKWRESRVYIPQIGSENLVGALFHWSETKRTKGEKRLHSLSGIWNLVEAYFLQKPYVNSKLRTWCCFCTYERLTVKIHTLYLYFERPNDLHFINIPDSLFFYIVINGYIVQTATLVRVKFLMLLAQGLHRQWICYPKEVGWLISITTLACLFVL